MAKVCKKNLLFELVSMFSICILWGGCKPATLLELSAQDPHSNPTPTPKPMRTHFNGFCDDLPVPKPPTVSWNLSMFAKPILTVNCNSLGIGCTLVAQNRPTVTDSVIDHFSITGIAPIKWYADKHCSSSHTLGDLFLILGKTPNIPLSSIPTLESTRGNFGHSYRPSPSASGVVTYSVGLFNHEGTSTCLAIVSGYPSSDGPCYSVP